MRSLFEVPAPQVHCEMNCITEELTELIRGHLWSLWLNFGWMSIQWKQIALNSVGKQQKLFCFFQLHTFVKLVYFEKRVKQTMGQGSHCNLWMWAINQIC